MVAEWMWGFERVRAAGKRAGEAALPLAEAAGAAGRAGGRKRALPEERAAGRGRCRKRALFTHEGRCSRGQGGGSGAKEVGPKAREQGKDAAVQMTESGEPGRGGACL